MREEREANKPLQVFDSRTVGSSVIPSESHDSVPINSSSNVKMSKSLRVKEININKMNNFNDLLKTNKLQNISLS